MFYFSSLYTDIILFFCLFLFHSSSCTISCGVMTSRCWSTWSNCWASWEERWRERRQIQLWMKILNPVVRMMGRRMQRHPWNTDHTSLLVLCDFTPPKKIMFSFSSHEISKVPFFPPGFLLSPAYQRLNLKSTDMHKRVALKAAVSSISFSQLFNAFTEISPYLSNASLNLSDRCWWKKLVLKLSVSLAAEAEHLFWRLFFFFYLLHAPTLGFYKQTYTAHTNKNTKAAC